MTDKLSEQLDALRRVSRLLEHAGIDYWLFGGWAVDFYVGSVTRAHDDVDLFVWLQDVPQIADLLQRDGWRHAPLAGEDGGTGYERESVRLELTYLIQGNDETVAIPMSSGPTVLDVGLKDDVRELRGVRTRLISLESLTRGKSTPRDDDPSDAAKDRADSSHLTAL
jgi:predicted nucleotidyltransferase